VDIALKNSWLLPVIQSIHIAGLALSVGMMAVVDLRLLGFGLRRVETTQVAARLAPWIRGGLVVVVTSGSILFLSDVNRFLHNAAFLVKIAVLLAALTLRFMIRPSKLAAAGSLILWTCVVVAGRFIADFDV
jgi:hypothetical protein